MLLKSGDGPKKHSLQFGVNLYNKSMKLKKAAAIFSVNMAPIQKVWFRTFSGMIRLLIERTILHAHCSSSMFCLKWKLFSRFKMKSSKAHSEKLKAGNLKSRIIGCRVSSSFCRKQGDVWWGRRHLFNSHSWSSFDMRSNAGPKGSLITQYTIRTDVSFVQARMPLL